MSLYGDRRSSFVSLMEYKYNAQCGIIFGVTMTKNGHKPGIWSRSGKSLYLFLEKIVKLPLAYHWY